MRKLIAVLAVTFLTSFAYAQEIEVNGKHNEGNARARVKARTHTETQVPRQSQELRNEFKGRADVNVRDETKSRIDLKDRTDVNVQPRSQTDVTVNAEQPKTETTVTRTEHRAEHRGGKFYFRDRELRRHREFDRNDWHFRIGAHNRTWYLTRYEVVWVDGCWYYLDGVYLYPAYGFDPDCVYPDQFIVFTFGG